MGSFCPPYFLLLLFSSFLSLCCSLVRLSLPSSPFPLPPPLSLSLLSALQRVPRRDIFDYERPPLFAGNEHQRFEWRSPRMLLMCRLRVYPPLTNVIYHYGRGRFSMREPSLHPLCLPVNLLLFKKNKFHQVSNKIEFDFAQISSRYT